MITERIKGLQQDCIERIKIAPADRFLTAYHTAAGERFAHLPVWERAARAMAAAINESPVIVFPDDRLGGRFYHRIQRINLTDADKDPALEPDIAAEQRFLKECPAYDELRRFNLIGTLTRGHIGWNYQWILSEGVEGLRAKTEKRLESAEDEQVAQFCKGILILLDALLEWNDRHAAAYEQLGLEELAARMRRVPRHPATTFREAVQAYYMQHIVVMMENPYGGNSPGRLDYHLWPYLEADLAAGRCTLEEAKEIIDELFLRIDERIHDNDGWGETLVLGGTKPDGSSAVNPLTYIMARSVMDLNITHPYTYIRLPKDAPKELIDLSVEFLIKGRNRAQILNDTAIISAMVKNGKPYADAAEYMCGGCMEISPQGMSSDYLYAGWLNIPKMLELTLTGGIDLLSSKRVDGFCATQTLTAFADFESFYTAFINESRRLIHQYLQLLNLASEASATARPSYLISSMIKDCLKRGKNMHQGGARYHDYGATPIGLPNAADSLIAIKMAVFDQKMCTAEELLTALAADFKGYERLQAQLRELPKYGEDHEEADALAARLMEDIAESFLSFTTRHGGRGLPIVLTFTFGVTAAAQLGATADGKTAGSLVAQGITPHSASMRQGLTAAMNSCLKMPFERFAGGASTMWDFDSAGATDELMQAVLRTFIQQGGQIFQGNTTPVEELLKAREHPEDYGHLIVRVGGFSARFVNLKPALQAEIIGRYRHCG